MPRPLRLHVEGALYYVTCRGALQMPVFQDSQDLKTYLELLAQYKVQHGFTLYAYALLPDHVHLLLQVGGGATISEIMHDLNSRYTKLHGKRYHRTGPLFQGRYRAVVVEKDPYLLRLTRYVHAHVAAASGSCTTPASSVAQPLATSLPHYLSQGTSCLDTAEVLARFQGPDPRAAYQRFVEAAVGEELEQLRETLQQSVVGSPAFVERLQRLRKGSDPEKMGSDPLKAPEPEPWQDDPEPKVEEPEPVLVPVRPVRPAPKPIWQPGAMLTAVATIGILSSVAGVTFLSGRAMAPQTVEQRRGSDPDNAGVRPLSAPAAQRLAQEEALPRASAQPVVAAAVPMPQPPMPSLSGMAWQIRVAPMYAKGSAPVQQDQLTFDGNQMASKTFTAKGFAKSGVSVTHQPDGMIVWETMQTHPGGETVFWRGEWDGQRMRGIFSRHPASGAPQDFVFIGVSNQPAAEEQTL